MKIFRNILVIVVLYIYLNNPILKLTGEIGTIKLLYPLIIFVLAPNVCRNIIKQKSILFCFIAILLYSIFRTIIGGSPTHIYTTIVAIIEAFFLPIIILSFCEKNNIDMYKSIIVVGIIACIITIGCLINPNVDLFFKNLMAENDVYERMSYRSYGFSDGLTFSYGIILATTCGLILLYSTENKYYVFLIPIFAVSIIVNARTGILVLILIIMVYFMINKRKIFGFILPVIILIILFSFFISSMDTENDTFKFAMDFFKQMGDFLYGTNRSDASTIDVLLGRMIVLPEYIDEWFFGRGISIYLNARQTSDVGFIIQLNYGGIVYMVMLFSLVYYLLRDISNKYILLYLLSVLIVSNIKGNFLINSGGFRCFVLIAMWFSIMRKKYNISSNKYLINEFHRG